MELSHPLATVTPTLDGDVLRLLAQPGVRLTSGQVHRLLGQFSEHGIRKVLVRLAGQGVLTSERVGNAYAYELNTQHLAAEAIMQLANLPRTLLDRIEERLTEWTSRPVYAAVFGSVARGSSNLESDLDVFLVRADDARLDEWDTQVTAFAVDVGRWTGNDVRPLEFTASEVASSKGEPVLHDILTEGLTVAGERSWLVRQLRS